MIERTAYYPQILLKYENRYFLRIRATNRHFAIDCKEGYQILKILKERHINKIASENMCLLSVVRAAAFLVLT